MWSAGQGDDKERFLADLRALRDTAALEFDELAARAHYPSDVLKEAESGPSLPTLPILAAYVRACDGDVPEWEERWRRLGFESRADPSLPVRPAGASPAAVAGARAGVSVAPPDAYDPDRIRAALRGHPRAFGSWRPRHREPGCSRAGYPGAGGRGAESPGKPGELERRDELGRDQELGRGRSAGHGLGRGRALGRRRGRGGRHACQREPSREPAGRWAARHRGRRDAGRGQGRGYPARSVLRRLAAGRGVDVAARHRVRVARPGRGRSAAGCCGLLVHPAREGG